MKDIKFEEEKVKRFPVLLKRGYFPADPDWPKNPATGHPEKALSGTTVELPIEEARKLIKDGIAERADELPTI